MKAKVAEILCAPPEPIEVRLMSDESAPAIVTLSLLVAATHRACRISDSAAASSGLSMTCHRLPVGSPGGSVYYLHDWGPAPAGSLVVVRVDQGSASTLALAKVEP